ncbi:MAG: 6-phosphogluconolactonase [Pseudomonadota bacterium]
MEIEIYPDDDVVSEKAAALIADRIREAVSSRGRFVTALSGGHTPWMMLRLLAKADLPWDKVYIFQVDERIAPPGAEERNLTHLRAALLSHAPLPSEHIYAMPVEAPEPEFAAQDYAETLRRVAGTPCVLDLVHLGLGADGHTASLVPGDPVLYIQDADVATTTSPYQGRRRMTLTFPLINRARHILWLVTGREKAGALARLRDGDRSIPAGRVSRDQALILADEAAT